MSGGNALRDRLRAARSGGDPDAVNRARRGLTAFTEAEAARGTAPGAVADRLAQGGAAVQIARIGLSAPAPGGLACRDGCAFCCILSGEGGALISETEAEAMHAALSPRAGEPDGWSWHPRACPALDPATRSCRAYDARPTICRAYVSTDASACESVAQGTPAPGPGTRGPWHDYLAALGLSRAALKGARRVATYALADVAAAAVEGADRETALRRARHRPAELEAELKRSRRDASRARDGAGLP